MLRTLVSLVSEQTAPNLMLLLDPAFSRADRYLFLSTTKMNETRKLTYLLAAANLPLANLQVLTISAFDPAQIYQCLEDNCPAKDIQYWVNLTGGTKMMALATWAYFTQNNIQAECFYVPLGENNYRRIFLSQQIEIIPLRYRFNLQTYLTAYGLSKQENPPMYTRNVEVEKRMFDDTIQERLPLAEPAKNSWWFANYLEHIRKRVKKKDRPKPYILLTAEDWIPEWLHYLGYTPKVEDRISQSELRYLISGWFEHYIHDVIAEYLQLPSDAIASQVKLYRSGQAWKYSNHEFDIIFLYRNRVYVIECKTAIRRNRRETHRLFNETIYRLAALKRDFGLNVSVGLVVLSDQLRRRKEIDPVFAKRADLLKVVLIDQPLLVAGPATWVSLLVHQD